MSRSTRREFIKRSSLLGAGLAFGIRLEPGSPNEKLDLAVIGVANRGAANLRGVSSQNVVALCDIDDKFLAAAGKRHTRAQGHKDFRRMLDAVKVDGVVISTADHTHAPAAAQALRLGRHVYCEKPLSHSVKEARVLTELAKKAKVATQMGTQIHAHENYRRVVELIRAGAIGPVREAHCWVGRSWVGSDRPKERPKIPSHVNYDLWVGPAPMRPYHPTYLPARWRGWWDFGGGSLSDMGCHHMDLVFWALELDAPTTIEAEGPPVHSESAPRWQVVRYAFPARGERRAVTFTWSHGGKRPAAFAKKDVLPKWGDGTLFVGERGMLLADYNRHVLLPAERFADYTRPKPSIPKSPGHYREWIEACKTGRPTTCDFSYSGPLTETVLLGNVAFRLGRKITWDAASASVPDAPEAAGLIARPYREGWTL